MQWVDFDIELLFGNQTYDPTSPSDRQFTLKNAKRKHKFQEKLEEIHTHQKIKERVLDLAEDFKATTEANGNDAAIIALVDRYQRLDTEITNSIIAAAEFAGRTNYGYQRSPALANAGTGVLLWKAIFSCVRRRTGFTERVGKLADRLSVPAEEYKNLTHKQAQQKLAEARQKKRVVEKEDGK
jgi:hypothetical protein